MIAWLHKTWLYGCINVWVDEYRSWVVYVSIHESVCMCCTHVHIPAKGPLVALGTFVRNIGTLVFCSICLGVRPSATKSSSHENEQPSKNPTGSSISSHSSNTSNGSFSSSPSLHTAINRIIRPHVHVYGCAYACTCVCMCKHTSAQLYLSSKYYICPVNCETTSTPL